MTEFAADMRALFQKGHALRDRFLDLVPPVDRVDRYAGTKLVPTVEKFRATQDGINQANKEVAVDFVTQITNYFMFHDEANNPDMTNDIIVELGHMLKFMHTLDQKSDQSENVKKLGDEVKALSTKLQSTIKQKDESINRELDEATQEVQRLDDEISAVDAKLVELRDKLNTGTIGSMLSKSQNMINSAMSSKGSTSSTKKGTGTNPGDQNEEIKKQIRELEAKRAVLEEHLKPARERKIKAVTAADARDAANTPATVAAVSKAEIDVASFKTESAKLNAAWVGFEKEVQTYLGLFVANRDTPSEETKRALSEHIEKVTSTRPTLEAFAKSLKDGAFNH